MDRSEKKQLIVARITYMYTAIVLCGTIYYKTNVIYGYTDHEIIGRE